MSQLIFDFDDTIVPSFDRFFGAANEELVHTLQHENAQFVYLWGQPATGKTHLLQAWAAKFTPPATYIDAHTIPLDEQSYETEHIAIDNIQALDLHEQEILFNIFNRLRNSGNGSLLISADVPPHALQIREDLRTRMGFCIVYEVCPLSDEDKITALIHMAHERQLVVDISIFHYLLNHWRRDMESLTAMLDTLDHYALSTGRRITLPMLRQLLKQQEP